MLKIFLAEDEFIVREGIKKNIDWTEHGYEFCGDAADGEIALSKIRELKPDIVITDIKMPFMDGIELSRNIKKEFPWIEIIILSGYSEFSYAKEAISLGVAHYLNKPISSSELLKQVDEISSKIKKNYEFGDINANEASRVIIDNFLKRGNKEDITRFVEELFDEIGEAALKSNMYRQYIAMDIYFSVNSFLNSYEIDETYINSIHISHENYIDIPSLKEYACLIISNAIDLRDDSAGNRYKAIIDKVKAYIDINYADETLSLNTLAEYVNFSPNHLSMVFSQQVGCSFIKYLTDYRMTKAKEILMCTSKRSVDISAEVGYKDPHYFSYLFKKTQGMTPTQYRSSRNTDENKKTIFD